AASWGAALEQAGATHAAVWRRLRAQPARPAVRWIPTHTELKQFQERGLHPLLSAGTMWADFFAKEGARALAVSQGYANFYGVEIECHKQIAAYIAWAMQRMLSRTGRAPSWAQYLRSPCSESEVAKLKADAIIEHVGAAWVQASEGGSFAMAALDASQGPLDPGDLAEAPSTLWALGDTAVDVQGHRLRRAGPTVSCQVCVAWSGSGASRALLEPCRGLPTGEGRDARTYLSNL
ncbi:unnamed protein product, partial [Prorocentrum cordatum]